MSLAWIKKIDKQTKSKHGTAPIKMFSKLVRAHIRRVTNIPRGWKQWTFIGWNTAGFWRETILKTSESRLAAVARLGSWLFYKKRDREGLGTGGVKNYERWWVIRWSDLQLFHLGCRQLWNVTRDLDLRGECPRVDTGCTFHSSLTVFKLQEKSKL